MLRKVLMSAVLAFTATTLFATAPAHAHMRHGVRHLAHHRFVHTPFVVRTPLVVSSPIVAQSPFVVYGPYATIRRANEVAFHYRSLGYSTLVYHNGDGYYVKVW